MKPVIVTCPCCQAKLTVDPELSAAAVCYGMPPSEERLQALVCPLLGFYGGADPRVTDTVPAMAKGLGA